MPARKLAEILGATPELNGLAALSQRVAHLQQIFSEAVPTELSKFSRVSSVRAGTVIVVADNGAIAAKLRQVAPRVLDRLRQRGFELRSIRVEVQVARALRQAPGNPPKRLSRKALSAIDEALAATQESPLRTALERLARHR